MNSLSEMLNKIKNLTLVGQQRLNRLTIRIRRLLIIYIYFKYLYIYQPIQPVQPYRHRHVCARGCIF